VLAVAVGLLQHNAAAADEPEPRKPLFRVADLNAGESQDVVLSDGSKVKITLLDVEETRDNVRSAIRLARVKVIVNGDVTTIESGNYRLPVTVAGVQIDCPATKGLYLRHDLFEDSWGLDKDARVRIWPKGSPWTEPGSFGYPIKQAWFGNVTQLNRFTERTTVITTTRCVLAVFAAFDLSWGLAFRRTRRGQSSAHENRCGQHDSATRGPAEYYCKALL
jgi:hypothetical protein